ncbi:MAG: response regulator [Oceanospirillaceae bacterium]
MRKPWKVLIVDDDEGIHSITRMVFRDYEFENRPIELLNALSGAQAKQILKHEAGIAVAIVDVVMETDQAGLNLVNFIRDQLKNTDIRIILRTGHPGFAPETEVVVQYDINDYLSKAELSASRLLTSVVVALRSFRDILSAKPKLQEAAIELAPSHNPLLLDGLSQYLNTKIQPLLESSNKLNQFNHKPMVADLISQLRDQSQQLAAINLLLQPITAPSAAKVDINHQLSQLVSSYLLQAKQQNWTIDYEIDTQLPSVIKVDENWFNTLLTTALELAICRLDKSVTSELVINVVTFAPDGSKLAISITGEPSKKLMFGSWQDILLLKLEELAAHYDGEIVDNESDIDSHLAADKHCLVSYAFTAGF